MWPILKIFCVGTLGAWSFLYEALRPSTEPTSILAYVGIALFIGGALRFGRYKEEVSALQRTLDTVNLERDVQANRAVRLVEEGLEKDKIIATFRAAPNLREHADLLRNLTETLVAHDKQSSAQAVEIIGILREIRSNQHEIIRTSQ